MKTHELSCKTATVLQRDGLRGGDGFYGHELAQILIRRAYNFRAAKH